MLSARSSNISRFSFLAAASVLTLLALAPLAAAQSRGPTTSGGNLPYIASGQSEEEIQKRKRARAEAEEKARQEAARTAAEEEKTRQETARAAQPEPAAAQPEPAAPTTATAAAPPPAEPAKPKTAARPHTTDLPPGVNPAVVGEAPRPVAPPPQQQRPAVVPTPPPGVVVVRRPMFFGLFGPEVNVTERVVVLTPPANVGSTQASSRPQAATGSRTAATRRGSESCHYHAYQAPGMGYAHRDVQCHWHQNPSDPSLRYVN
jgi:hypothetical protein